MIHNERLNAILIEGLKKFGLSLGIISSISGERYTVSLCNKNDFKISPGDTFELSETYCADVIKAGTTKFYRDVAEITEMLKHPVYLNTQLRAYIGTPILVNGKIWGTINYSSLTPHKQTYSVEEINFIENQAVRIGEIISEKH